MPPDIQYPGPPQQTQSLLGGDPLHLIGALGQLTQLQNLQRTMAARQATGNALNDALGPQGLDTERAFSNLKGDPNASYNLQASIPQVLAAKGQQIQNDTAAFGQFAAQNDYARGLISGLASKPNATAEDVNNWAATVSRNADPRAVPSSMIRNVVQSITSDPDGIPTALRKMQTQVAGAGQSMQRVQGPPGAQGEQTTVSLGQAHVAIPGSMSTSLPPGSEASAGVMQADLARAGNFGQEIFPWKQALEKLQALGPAGIGPGTEGRKQVASFIYSALGPTVSRWGGIDPERLKNFDEAQKYLTQATLQRAASFGHGTDQQLATTITGNPNVHINDLAAVDVTKMGIATRAMEHAQTLYASKFGPANYTKAKADFAAQQDPRAYLMSMGLASPEQIDGWKKTLKGAERDKFNASLRTAKEAGLFQ